MKLSTLAVTITKMRDETELSDEADHVGGQGTEAGEEAGGGKAAEAVEEAGGGGATEEIVDGLPLAVLAGVRPVVRAPPAVLPGVQAAAVAATGFLAGAATVALLKRHGMRGLARAQQTLPRDSSDLLPVRGSRRFIVDVHVIAKPGE